MARTNSYSENLHNVIRGGPDRIHILLAKDPHEAHTISFQNPLLQSLKLSILCDDDFLLVVGLWKMHVHLQRQTQKGEK